MLPDYFDRKYRLKRALVDYLRAIPQLLKISPTYWKLKRVWKGAITFEGKSCVVIAGGPSFTDDLANFVILNRKKFVVIALNFYCKSEYSKILIPDIYVLSDPAHLTDDGGILKISNDHLAKYIGDHCIDLACPFQGDWRRYGNGKYYFDDRETLAISNTTPLLMRGYPSNTAFKAIALAKFLKFDTIYVVGLDYDFPRKLFLDGNNRLHLRDEHHYGVKVTDYSQIFNSVAHALSWWAMDFHNFKKISSSQVVNVTDSSLVDFFKRMKPDEFMRYDF